MLTIGIGLLALFLIYMGVDHGEWVCVGLVVVVTLLLIAMAHNDRQETKAYLNFRDYWADGGPDRK